MAQKEEAREQMIQNITKLLRRNTFTFEFKVKKKPQGIKVIYEVTQEVFELYLMADSLYNQQQAAQKYKEEKKED